MSSKICKSVSTVGALVFVRKPDGGNVGGKITKTGRKYLYWDAGQGEKGRATIQNVRSQNSEMIENCDGIEASLSPLGNLKNGATRFIDLAGQVWLSVGIGWIHEREATSEDFNELPLLP